MTDSIDDTLDAIDESPEEAREWFHREVKTRGVRIAYKALTSVCEDPKAPAPAKATAGVAILRAAGVFARADEDPEIEPHEMTPAQLARAAALARKEVTSRAQDGDDPGGVFA